MSNADIISLEAQGGNWAEILADHRDILTPVEWANIFQLCLGNNPTLLNGMHLAMAVGKKRAAEIIEKLYERTEILPELDAYGAKRCVALLRNGKRCCSFSELRSCPRHIKRVCMFTNMFKDATLRERYEAILRSPAKIQLDAEQAMMRLMLTELINKLDAGEIPIDMIAQVSVLCEKIVTVTEKMSKMNEITPETIQKIFDGITDIVAKYVPPEHLVAVAAEVQALQPKTKPVENIPFEPGNAVRIGEKEQKFSLIQNKLRETAARLAIDSGM